MRVIAGRVKGRALESPKSSSVRPTTGLVRGAIFSILQPLVDQEWQAVDLYAGTGALGIEALSRGAKWVDFVEQNPKCCAAIRKNLATMELKTQARVYCCSVKKALSLLDRVYDVVFLDPPYSDSTAPDFLKDLFVSSIVGPNSMVVVQFTTRQPLPEQFGVFRLLKAKHYGDTSLSFYAQEA